MAQLIDFNNFTVDNGAIRDLNELLFTSTFNDPNLEEVVRIVKSAENGKKLGWIDSIDDVGEAGGGCDPTYSNVKIHGYEKAWKLGEWEIPKEFCYKELTNTLAKYGMKPGTMRGDLQDTPYWDKFLIPLLQKAITDMFWRFTWFGDTDAKLATESGVLKAGVEPKLFKPCDGLWKRLKAIIASNAAQKTAIAANEEATYAEQKSKIREEGVAINIIDTLLTDADGRIFDKDHAILMTNSLFKALRADVYRRTKYQLTTDKLMDGILVSQYDGVKIFALDIWDRMIKKYEDDGTKYNLPHRAVLCNPDNLLVGTSDTDLFGQLDITFDHKTRKNSIYVGGDIDTLIGEDELVQIAL